jgi:quinolinate synthase
MKKTTLRSVYEALRTGQPAVTVDERLALRARVALDRMLALA